MFQENTCSSVTLSHLTDDGADEKILIHDDIEVMVHSLVASIPTTPEKINELKKATQQDETLQILKATLQQG